MQEIKVKPGYKMTELGVIPEDWKSKELQDVVVKDGGLVRGPFGGALKKEIFVRKGFKIYEQKNAIYRNNKIGEYYIDRNKFNELKRFEVKPGDFIVSCSGTIGRIFQIPIGSEKGVINQALLKIKVDENIIDDEYFFYQFDWDKFQNKIIDGTQGGAMKNLVGMDVFKKTSLPIPSLLNEQKLISGALHDVDKVIHLLNNLIRKKENIKEGTMQELLTGKRRLPGFDGEWEEKKLGDICEIKKGQLITSETCIKGNIPVIAGGKQPAYYNNQANRKANTITISASGANAGYVNFHKYPIFASDCSTIEESKNYSIYFIYNYLQLLQNKIYKFQTGGAQPHIHPSDLNPLEINIPKDINEQKAIAEVLFDIDNEIENLKTKRDKYKEIKEGMMQELLTGKTRLV